MKVLKFIPFILLLAFSSLCYAQTLSLELPVKEEVKIGQELIIKLNAKGIEKHSIKMTGNPASAIIQNNKFVWTPKDDEKKYYLITFHLYNGDNVLVDEQNLALTVTAASLPPELTFDRKMGDTIYVTENEQFSFSAKIKSKRGTDPRLLIPYFTFNENPNLRQFEDNKITIQGDQLLFSWTPSNYEALEEYLKFRITIIDIDKSMLSEVLNFKVKNVNQPPYFAAQPHDTVYQKEGQELVVDYTAIDPDNDKLEYDYTPSNPKYSLNGSKLVVQSDNNNFPLWVTIKVSDGKNTLKHKVCILKNAATQSNRTNAMQQPLIGDLTRKIFSEGDSIETYLNISNEYDLRLLDLTYSDLNLSPGIEKISPYLIFEKRGSYIKVKSKGALAYNLVDRDYTYNITFKMTSPDGSSYSKILVLTVLDKPDPFSISRQRDSLTVLMNGFLQTEGTYKATLQKVRTRIGKPWWKKVAVVTGTLSGILTLIQASNSNKDLSIISAIISLTSITVSNIPTLSEKKLTWISNKITDSNSRIDIVQRKQDAFNSAFLFDINQTIFNLKSQEIKDIIRQSTQQRKNDICELLADGQTSRKIKRLIKQSNIGLEDIFKCAPQTP